ncbi:MAG: outer membrane protein assembly factor BamA [Rhodothermales bacterium]
MRFYPALVFIFLMLFASSAAAQSVVPASTRGGTGLYQQAPRPYEILGLSVEGVEEESMRTFVLQNSGLAEGQTVTIPGDQAIADAIRNIYRLRVFSDVKIVEERRVGSGVFLVIRVKEEPQLNDYTFSGMKKKHAKELKKKIPLFKGNRVRPGDVERSRQVIREFYEEKGYLLTTVEVNREEMPQNRVNLEFVVERGPRVEVEDIVVKGNEAFSSRKIRKKMKETKKDRWWRFWSKANFDRKEYESDKDLIIQYYNQKGYFDARIVRDSVYLDTSGDRPGIVVEVEVHEGPRYHIRDIVWEGNTVYPDGVLSAALGIEKGDVYNQKKLDQNLYANRRSSDISSLYMNRGHMLFRVQPEVRVVEGDSLDLYFDMFEGDVFTFGEVAISGNSKTKEHVIRRELYTIPGQTFSRDAIQETIRRLSQLNYFDQESLGTGPGININEEKKSVDLAYKLEEVGSDQLELSGTYGRFGLVLMLRFGFNNFSVQDIFKKGAWKPLPSGDGQRLSLSLQTNGKAYQSYSLGYTEPWFRGRPTPVGFSVSHSRFKGVSLFGRTADDGRSFVRTSVNVFYEQRLKWPDDRFSLSTGIGYQFFSNQDFAVTLPAGISQEITVRQSISRSSLDHPVFPTAGSQFVLSLDVAPPIGDFIQYHKWRFKTNWNVPLQPKLTLNFTSDFGYIGSLTGDDVLFQRFVVGGSPFDVQGFRDSFGKDIIFGRGYPARAIGPRRNDEPVGGRILNKYTSELRWLAVQSPQLSAAPYVFLDAANTWNNFGTYNPTQLFRSAGFGARLFLPILGMLELTYGYNFDEFVPIQGLEGRHNGSKRWLFQFSLGQGFTQ